MEYLVENHMGGYYISNSNPETIQRYCEQCGDHDWIILSWEEGTKFDTLLRYFSVNKKNQEEIENEYECGVTKEELIEYLKDEYDCDRSMINELTNEELLNKEERLQLLKQVSISQRNQFELLRNINYVKGPTKVYKRKKIKI